MLLSDIFEQLTFGELNQFSMGGSEGNKIRPEDYRRVISHVNMGLTELHKRFWLISRQVMVQLYDHIQTYTLDKKYALSNTFSTELYKYIVDSVYEPFDNDLLKIEEIYNEEGEKLCLNNLNECYSLFTPTYNSIQVPIPYPGSAISVHYRGNHSPIIYTPDLDPEQVEVELPVALLECLLIYIGGRASGVLNSDAGQEGNNYLARFEASCKLAESLGFQITPQYSNLKLDYKGWV